MRWQVALGSSCFGLLFLGSGSTFGSISPPLSGGAILPLYPSSFFAQLTQKASPGPAATLASPNEGITADPSFGFPVALPGVLPQASTEILAQELRSAKNLTTSPLSLLGVRRRILNLEGGGTTFAEFPTEGFARWQAREAFTDGVCWSMVPVRLGGETLSEFPAMLPRRAVSDFLLQ